MVDTPRGFDCVVVELFPDRGNRKSRKDDELTAGRMTVFSMARAVAETLGEPEMQHGLDMPHGLRFAPVSIELRDKAICEYGYVYMEADGEAKAVAAIVYLIDQDDEPGVFYLAPGRECHKSFIPVQFHLNNNADRANYPETVYELEAQGMQSVDRVDLETYLDRLAAAESA